MIGEVFQKSQNCWSISEKTNNRALFYNVNFYIVMPHKTYTTKAPCYANIVILYLKISFLFLTIQLKRQIKHLINLIFCVNFICVLLLTSEQT